ncbi:hypothetical protein HYS96_04565 [Candidatus Daviesbacteria bacterium]|nr:hypothetical protein [Candidatus Daviesbacteria bacterium]
MHIASKIFWRKFIRYLLVGCSALTILAGFNYVDGFQRGPMSASAEEVGFISSGESDLPMDGFPVGFISQGEQPLPGTQTTTTTPTNCPEVRNTPYGQCGGTVGLEGRDPTHQFEVVRITDSCTGGILRYEVTRDAGAAETCGFRTPPPPPPPPPPPTPSQYESYSACGQSGQLWVGGGYRRLQPSDCGGNTYLHVFSDSSGYLTNACEAIPPGGEKNGDGCGWHQAAAPAAPAGSACGTREVDEGCADSGFRSFRTIDTCSGFSSARRVWDSSCLSTIDNSCQEFVTASFCSSQGSRTERVRNTCTGLGEFTRTVWDSSCGFSSGFFPSSFCSPTEIFSSDTCVGNGTRERVFTNSCTGGEMRRERFFDGNCLVSGPVVTQPVITQQVGTQPTVVRFATVDAVCPAGSTRTVEGNVVTCTIPAPATFGNVGVARVITAQAPVVQGVKELPKTGLPLLAWAALAFVPAGLKIRGFSKVKMETAAKPHFLYEERQFKVGS